MTLLRFFFSWVALRKGLPLNERVLPFVPVLAMIGVGGVAASTASEKEDTPQYQHGEIVIPHFRADEPKREKFSATLADEFLRRGAIAWSRERKCVSCHTAGTYLATRPSLTRELGPPSEEVRALYLERLARYQKMPREKFSEPRGTAAGEVVYLALGLAEWDKHVSRRRSRESNEALSLMLEAQLASGAWQNPVRWPPFESDGFHLATFAALALAAAPQWVAQATEPQQAAMHKLRTYLRETPPPHDYGGTLLLWAAVRWPNLLTEKRKQELIEAVWRHQQPDGGWSIRSFARPEEWGNGYRAEKLRSEPEYLNPSSDGHQTGFAIVVLREAGIPANDERIQRGIRWLKENQRVSGRWWTRSLNTDEKHFISYSGTVYPLMAFALCGELLESPSPGNLE